MWLDGRYVNIGGEAPVGVQPNGRIVGEAPEAAEVSVAVEPAVVGRLAIV